MSDLIINVFENLLCIPLSYQGWSRQSLSTSHCQSAWSEVFQKLSNEWWFSFKNRQANGVFPDKLNHSMLWSTCLLFLTTVNFTGGKYVIITKTQKQKIKTEESCTYRYGYFFSRRGSWLRRNMWWLNRISLWKICTALFRKLPPKLPGYGCSV